jgi:hypothetical protein
MESREHASSGLRVGDDAHAGQMGEAVVVVHHDDLITQGRNRVEYALDDG